MYKPEHIPESGSFARSLAKMAKYYHASIETWKLTTSFEDGRAVYTLHGRDSSLDTFESRGFTPEQVTREANQELAARYTGKHKNELAAAEQIQVPEVVNKRTTEQAGEIIRLLNHPLITRQEKTKMLLNLNRLDADRATQAIAKLRQAIEDREGTTAVAA